MTCRPSHVILPLPFDAQQVFARTDLLFDRDSVLTIALDAKDFQVDRIGHQPHRSVTKYDLKSGRMRAAKALLRSNP